jgi:hypothetical protein
MYQQIKYAYCDIHVILLLTFVNWSVFFSNGQDMSHIYLFIEIMISVRYVQGIRKVYGI